MGWLVDMVFSMWPLGHCVPIVGGCKIGSSDLSVLQWCIPSSVCADPSLCGQLFSLLLVVQFRVCPIVVLPYCVCQYCFWLLEIPIATWEASLWLLCDGGWSYSDADECCKPATKITNGRSTSACYGEPPGQAERRHLRLSNDILPRASKIIRHIGHIEGSLCFEVTRIAFQDDDPYVGPPTSYESIWWTRCLKIMVKALPMLVKFILLREIGQCKEICPQRIC